MSVLSQNKIVLLKTNSQFSLNLTHTITIRLDISILQQNISILYKTFELNTMQIHNFQNVTLRNMFVYCLSSPICRSFSNWLLTSKFTVKVNSWLLHTNASTHAWMDDDQDKELKLVPNVARVELRPITPYSWPPPPTHTWTDADQKRGYDMQPRAKRRKGWLTRVDMKTL